MGRAIAAPMATLFIVDSTQLSHLVAISSSLGTLAIGCVGAGVGEVVEGGEEASTGGEPLKVMRGGEVL